MNRYVAATHAVCLKSDLDSLPPACYLSSINNIGSKERNPTIDSGLENNSRNGGGGSRLGGALPLWKLEFRGCDGNPRVVGIDLAADNADVLKVKDSS